MDKRLTAILNEASFAPKRVYTIYFYYKHHIDSLPFDFKDKRSAQELLKQILDIKMEEK